MAVSAGSKVSVLDRGDEPEVHLRKGEGVDVSIMQRDTDLRVELLDRNGDRVATADDTGIGEEETSRH